MKQISIRGRYNTAKLFTTDKFGTTNDHDVLDYLKEILDNPMTKHCNIRVMPNLYFTKDYSITGFTMKFQGRIAPNLLGSDLGCGLLAVKLIVNENPDYLKLHTIVKNNFFQRNTVHSNFYNPFDLDKSLDELIKSLDCYYSICDNKNYDITLGTLDLQDKSHFISLATDSNHDYWLLVHDGSHQLGSRVANHYINKAHDFTQSQGFTRVKIPWVDSVVKSQFFNDYRIVEHYAYVNRWTIVETLMSMMNWEMQDYIHSVHNHIDVDNKVFRKGAITATHGEQLVIPINIKDGFLLCTGKGNSDWNYCAPASAGRILYRSQAKKYLIEDEYLKIIDGTFRLVPDKIDESPQCFRQIKDIAFSILDTVEVIDIIKPIKDGS